MFFDIFKKNKRKKYKEVEVRNLTNDNQYQEDGYCIYCGHDTYIAKMFEEENLMGLTCESCGNPVVASSEAIEKLITEAEEHSVQ
jgi:transcription initiation factor IIE alpha subunit